MDTIMWCLECEDMKIVIDDCHMIYKQYGDFGFDIYGCAGPFFTSAPPEDMSDNWQDELDEPSEEELVEINKMSDLLLWDLGLSEK